MAARHSEAVRKAVMRLDAMNKTAAEIGAALGLSAKQVAGIIDRMWRRTTEKG